MLPVERQKRIKEWVKSKQFIKISELSTKLGVSEMTIHRDIKPLIEEGIVTKTFGGITLVQGDSGDQKEQANDCVYCARPVHERLAYRIILPKGVIENTCCAHCGLLRHRQLGSQVIQAICHDFLSHTTISGTAATYVMGTSVQIGCCDPQVLAFGHRQHAVNFVNGFGGDVYAFDEAMEAVDEKMKNNTNACCQHGEGLNN